MRSPHLSARASVLAAEAKVLKRKEARLLHKVRINRLDRQTYVERYRYSLEGPPWPLMKGENSREVDLSERWLKNHARRDRVDPEVHERNVELLSLAFRDLRKHRVVRVRREARAVNLAIAFLRGHAYERVETTRRTKPDWERVHALVQTYARIRHTPQDLAQRLEEWIQRGEEAIGIRVQEVLIEGEAS